MRREITYEEEHRVVHEISSKAVPADPPHNNKTPATWEITRRLKKTTAITSNIEIEIPKSQRYLAANLVIKDQSKFNEAITINQLITIVSDGGLKNRGHFG